jgi:hypothetical protein
MCSNARYINSFGFHMITFPTVYILLGERYSYPNAPSMTVIPAGLVPAKTGIHRGRRSAPPSRSDPPE